MPAFCLGFALLVVAVPWRAAAEPALGDKAPDVFAEAPDGAVVQLRRLRGQWIVLLYEDRDTTKTNQALKDALRKRARRKAFRKRVRVVAVADTSDYDFWPAKGFAKSAILKRGKKLGLRIYCDWSGAMRLGLGLAKGKANVVVIDPKGGIRARHVGALSARERRQVLALVSARGRVGSSGSERKLRSAEVDGGARLDGADDGRPGARPDAQVAP